MAQALRQSRDSGTPLREVVASMPEIARVLTPDQIASLEVPEAYLGSAEAFRARLVEAAARRTPELHRSPMPLIQTPAAPATTGSTAPTPRRWWCFSHSLGQDHGQWDVQALDLLPHVRVLRYDTRGHGASAAPAATTRWTISAATCSR